MGFSPSPEREARVVRTRFGAAMAPKVQQSKEAKALAAANSSKGKKKKWSKGKLITISILCDRLRLNGSLARKALNKLKEEGLIKPVVCHGQQVIYTRAGGAA